MDAAPELASTWAMRASRFVAVCLGLTFLGCLGCGPEPTVKQPDPSASAGNTTQPAPSATTTAPSTTSTAATSGSSSPTPSATGVASAAPTNSATTTNPDTALVGSLSNAEIQKAINDNIKLFDACYTLGADKQGKLEGTVTVKATVGPLGNVKEATVQKSTMKNSKVDTCVADAFKKVKFPQPKGGVAIITYPMTFGGEVVIKK